MSLLCFNRVNQQVQTLLATEYEYIDSDVVNGWRISMNILLRESIVMYNSAPDLFPHYKTSRLRTIDTDIERLRKKGVCTAIREERRTMLCIIFEAIERVS